MDQYLKRTIGYQDLYETDPNYGSLFVFGKIKQTLWCNFLKYFKKIAPWFFSASSRNQIPPWLESASFDTLSPKVRFEYWTIFEGYLLAEISEKQLWTFFVYSKIKDKKNIEHLMKPAEIFGMNIPKCSSFSKNVAHFLATIVISVTSYYQKLLTRLQMIFF